MKLRVDTKGTFQLGSGQNALSVRLVAAECAPLNKVTFIHSLEQAIADHGVDSWEADFARRNPDLFEARSSTIEVFKGSQP